MGPRRGRPKPADLWIRRCPMNRPISRRCLRNPKLPGSMDDRELEIYFRKGAGRRIDLADEPRLAIRPGDLMRRPWRPIPLGIFSILVG